MVDKMTQTLDRMQRTIERREKSRVYQLPMWPDPVRGTPNAFLRSALFPAIQGKHRKTLRRELLAAQKGTSVRYTGLQLNQSDLDVWEQAVHLARHHPLGDECQFTAHAFLKSINRKTGGSQHEQLKDVIARLSACTVEITHKGKTYGGSLIDEFYRDEDSEVYKLKLNKKLINLYDSDTYTHIHWETRRLLARKELAQWVHGYYSSHKSPYPVKVETLHALCGSSTKTPRKFKQNLLSALDNLVAVGFLSSYEIDDSNLLSVTRN